MFVHSATRALLSMAVIATPAVAQTALGPYAPASARYRITASTKTSQNMMGQVQEFETSASQLLSLSVAKAGDALTLTMTLDSATITTTSPEPAPDLSEAIGMKFTGSMAVDGKVASSEVTDKTGAPSKSPLAGNLRSILPRLKLGATSGATWVDSSTIVTKQNDAEVTAATAVTFTLAGDTTVAGVKAWKIVGASAGKLSGTGNRMGTDYTLTGDVKGISTSLVSMTGMLLGVTVDSDTNLTATVESAGMTIPIVQKTTTKIEKLP
jgi:hypothetical protein